MATKDRYAGFAERYDLFPCDPASSAFFERLFRENQITSVLDCACGTGRDLILFHSLGCDVVGSDLSPSMLAAAKKNLASAGVEVPLLALDYRNLPEHFDRPFDVVVCLSGSLLEASDDEEMLGALRNMRGVLRQGGLLILTQGMTDKMWRERPRFILDVDTPEVSRLFVIDYLDHGARFNILDIFHAAEESRLKVWSMEHQRVLLGADYERLLRDAGFSDVRLFGAYDFEPYDAAQSDRLIVVATK